VSETFLQLVRAPNPGPMTLDGTNTWIVGDPAVGAPIVVDPGPMIEAHLEEVLRRSGGRIQAVVLTHHHLDHAESAGALAERVGCGVRAADPAFRVGPESLLAGDELIAGGVRLEVLAAPGHTWDSMALLLTGPDSSVRLLSGDTVLGRGTTVITHPEGDLGDYLDTIARLQDLVRARDVTEILPGHGPVVDEPAETLAYYLRHRQERLDQVRAALAAGDRDAAEVVRRVYADVDRSVWPAAEQSVRAQLAYLESGSDGSGGPGLV